MLKHTRDGSEIRRSPVEVGRLSHYLRGALYTVPGGDRRICEPSTVFSEIPLFRSNYVFCQSSSLHCVSRSLDGAHEIYSGNGIFYLHLH